MRVLSALLFTAICVLSQAKDFGTGVKENLKVKVSEIYKNPAKFVGKEITVEGLILDVCSKRGCWMKLSSDEKFQDILIKVNDGEIVFPMSDKGKLGSATGILQEIKLSKEQSERWLRHQAKEKGMEFDPASVKGPMTIYRIKATGAKIAQ